MKNPSPAFVFIACLVGVCVIALFIYVMIETHQDAFSRFRTGSSQRPRRRPIRPSPFFSNFNPLRNA